MRKKETTYVILLLVLAFYFILGIGSFSFMTAMVATNNPDSSQVVKIALRYCSFIYLCYIIAIILTIAARYLRPELGRVLSKVLNIVLLLLLPFGTIVGTYGLLYVDKESEENSSPTTETS